MTQTQENVLLSCLVNSSDSQRRKMKILYLIKGGISFKGSRKVMVKKAITVQLSKFKNYQIEKKSLQNNRKQSLTHHSQANRNTFAIKSTIINNHCSSLRTTHGLLVLQTAVSLLYL